MNIKKAIIACLIITFLSITAFGGLLYYTSKQLIEMRGYNNLEPSITLNYYLTKQQDKKTKASAQMAIFISAVLSFGAGGLMIYGIFAPKKRELHGSARFANQLELKKSGLLDADKPTDKYPSIIVGMLKGKYLLLRGQLSAFLAAPTRSGKGVGIVVPNCLHYKDSMVIEDVKGELYNITAGFRQKCGQQIYRFSPDDENRITDQWNPLYYVRHDEDYRVKDLMDITSILYPPDDDVWSSSAENLFLGLALYIIETESEHHNLNIAGIKKLQVNAAFLKNIDIFNAYVEERKNTIPLSNDCITFLRAYAKSSDKQRSSIDLSFNAPLGVFSDPIAANATSGNSFDFRDLRKKRMTIYVTIQPDAMVKYEKLLNLFFNQIINLNLKEQPQDNPKLKYQCLFLLDEFAALGRISILEKASAFMAGYNLRMLLVFQSKSQLRKKELYGQEGADNLLTNMAMQIIFAPRETQDAKEYSEMIGHFTEKGKSKSRPDAFLSSKTGGRSETESDQRRDVLYPQEVKAIGEDKQIISMENMLPALVSKIKYYEDPILKARANLPIKSHIKTKKETPVMNILEPLISLPDVFKATSKDIDRIAKGLDALANMGIIRNHATSN